MDLADTFDSEIKSLLLTGGTGFFGRSLLRYIDRIFSSVNKQPPPVTVVTRSKGRFFSSYPEFEKMAWLKFHEGDIMSGLSGLPVSGEFSHVIHAAAESIPPKGYTQLQRFDENLTGTRNLLDLAVECGVKRFLLTSSGGAYGPQPTDMLAIPESHLGIADPLKTESAYGVAKRAAEHLCVLYSEEYRIETVVARCFAFVGPDLALDAHFAIGNFIRDALMSDEIRIKGDGSPLRTYMYQDDLAEWLLSLLLKGEAQQAYNVGSKEVVSILELAEKIKNLLAPEKPLIVEGRPDRESAVRNRYVPDIRKAENEMGLKVKYPLDVAIELTAKGVMASA